MPALWLNVTLDKHGYLSANPLDIHLTYHSIMIYLNSLNISVDLPHLDYDVVVNVPKLVPLQVLHQKLLSLHVQLK